MITPRTLKGFRDFLPQQMIPREQLVDVAKRVYRSFGFSPIDTPVLEYLEILDGKGGAESDRLIYRFKDHGERSVGMRFDLTVPLARFVAQHHANLRMPFKRYHIAKVWRGENTHRGRYREFMQCDFDTIGTTSVASDIETILVIHDLLAEIGFQRFTVHVNNRLVLNGLLDKLGLTEKAAAILRSLDKLAKIGPEKVAAEMCTAAGTTSDQADQVLRLAALTGSNDEVLDQLLPLVTGNSLGEQGHARLGEMIQGVRSAGVDEDRVKLDVSIARGLDYYTGAVFETMLDDLPSIGSVCSGGRYDDLASVYTKQRLPGIGASLGLDRLLAAMDELGMLSSAQTPAQVLVVYFDKARLGDYLQLASLVRRAGLAVELYPEPKKLGQQLKYAGQQGFRVALIAGDRELTAGVCQVKDLSSGESSEAEITPDGAALVAAIERVLAPA